MATRMSQEVYLESKSVSCHEKSAHQHRALSKMAQRKPKALWVQAGADVKGNFLRRDDQTSHKNRWSQFSISPSKGATLGKQGRAEALG